MSDSTYQPKIYRKQGGAEQVIADGGKLIVESGGTIEVESGGALNIADGALAVDDVALANGKILVGNASGKGAEVSMSGDVTIDNTGATTIGAKKVLASMTAIANGKILIGGADGAGAEQILTGDVTVTNGGVTAIGAGKVTSAMLADGAGVAALLTAGLGGSVSVTKTDAATTTIVAAHDTKDRACLVLVVVDETYDVGTTGTLPTVKIGEDDAIEKCMAGTVLNTEAAGTVLAFAFTNTAKKKIIVTTTAAVGDATGGCSITVLAIPTT